MPREAMIQMKDLKRTSSMRMIQGTMMPQMTVTSKSSMKKPTIWISQYPNAYANPKNTE